ncbi:MAG: hypothetical protein LGB78_06355 [Sulfurovum sp.]|nr:hypothetical protein [Sulfurovum sp.]MCB4763508.1 hypothetical protein [Sulfurovum sp.]MCB4773390.1 hypothetical protein [Sulfurovum sp.]MCB4782071.1 hypothetical protein [Sulfurovum sp.]
MEKTKRDLFSKNIETIKDLLQKKNKLYSLEDLNLLLGRLKTKRLIAQDVSSRRFFDLLQNRLGLKTYSVSSKKINKVRYSLYSDINIYDFVSTFEKQGFFSMTTALNIQQLSNQKDNFVFFSKELSLKKYFGNNLLVQDDIDQAYQKEYRFTRSIASYEDKHIIYLTPKNTKCFEVIEYDGYAVSSVHRAFVEMIMNVQYFKNFDTVIKIFEPLKDKLDPKKVFDVVRSFNPIYPYYQLVGFSLHRIGFDEKNLVLFKEHVTDLKFYTEKNKHKYSFDNDWNMYY